MNKKVILTNEMESAFGVLYVSNKIIKLLTINSL